MQRVVMAYLDDRDELSCRYLKKYFVITLVEGFFCLLAKKVLYGLRLYKHLTDQFSHGYPYQIAVRNNQNPYYIKKSIY